MKPNKSIDGLVTRDSKKSSPKSSTPKKSTTKATKTSKTTSATKPTKKPKAIKVDNISDDLEISIVSDEIVELSSSDDASTSQPAPTQTVDDFLSPIQAFNPDEELEKKPMKSKKSNRKNQDTDTDVNQKPSKKDKKKPSKARKIITIIALIIVLALIGLILWAVLWGNDIIAKITGGQGNVFDLLTFVDDTYEPLKTDANGRTNILAFGTSGYNMQGDEGNGTHAGAQLTDSIMMISLNQETGDIAMLSLPRDLKASPTCTATGKINEVYWCNNMYGEDEAAGATALMTEVGSILGVDFQYYAHLNWGSLIYIVDTLGGIEITLDEDIFDDYWTGASFEAGVTYTINGEQALGLARARHGTFGGDFSRGASQQKILIGIKDKIFEKDLSITDMLGLASNLGDNLRTNFSISDIKTLAHLTWEFDFDSMRTLSLYPDYMTTGTLDNGISYVFPRAGVGNYGNIQAYVAEQLSNDPRVYENPTILVLNATDIAGLASDERVKLVEAGYTSVDTDNAPEGEYDTGYTLYVISQKPGSEDMLESYYKLTAETEVPEIIPRTHDFVIIVNPEAEVETEVETE